MVSVTVNEHTLHRHTHTHTRRQFSVFRRLICNSSYVSNRKYLFSYQTLNTLTLWVFTSVCVCVYVFVHPRIDDEAVAVANLLEYVYVKHFTNFTRLFVCFRLFGYVPNYHLRIGISQIKIKRKKTKNNHTQCFRLDMRRV